MTDDPLYQINVLPASRDDQVLTYLLQLPYFTRAHLFFGLKLRRRARVPSSQSASDAATMPAASITLYFSRWHCLKRVGPLKECWVSRLARATRKELLKWYNAILQMDEIMLRWIIIYRYFINSYI